MCTGNSCRSQMAHGYLKHYLPDVKILSAGVERHGLNTIAVKVMAEDGINISDHTSNLIDEYINEPIDLIITVCDHANESCPVFPSNVTKIHQNFKDPACAKGTEEIINKEFIQVRDEIKAYCAKLARELA